jgi:L-threonylcarbamoyladenylate synthase
MTSIREARNALRNGSLIIYPTDTVWGIGCDPFNQESVDILFKMKGKKEDGVSILINDKRRITEFCLVKKRYVNLIEKLLPGPVTLILKSKITFAKGVTKNDNIAVRIPNNKTSISLVKENPIITTSANLHGKKIAQNIDEARKIFGNSCIYLDGEKPTGIESTIIDLTNNTPKIIRIGALYGDSLEDILEH